MRPEAHLLRLWWQLLAVQFSILEGWHRFAQDVRQGLHKRGKLLPPGLALADIVISIVDLDQEEGTGVA